MSKCYRSAIITIAGVLLIAAGMSYAAVPTRMTVQGKLTNAAGDPVPAGLKSFTFKIYDAAVGGSEIWPAGPGEVQPLSTDADGLWTVEVGALVPLTATVFSGDTRWLEVTVNDGVNPVETLPRIKLNTSPYTFQSEQSNNAANADRAADTDNLGGQPPSAFAQNVHMHDAATVTDEPGITSRANLNPTTWLPQGTTTMQDLVTCTITVAEPGYIVVRGRTNLYTLTTTSSNYGYFQIDETEGGTNNADYTEGGVSGVASLVIPIFSERVFAKPAGTYVFRLEGRSAEFNAPGAQTGVFNHQITATYFPKAYGTVAP